MSAPGHAPAEITVEVPATLSTPGECCASWYSPQTVDVLLALD